MMPRVFHVARNLFLVLVLVVGGCQHYQEEDRVAKNILPRKPDLVFIGGMSQKDSPASAR